VSIQEFYNDCIVLLVKGFTQLGFTKVATLSNDMAIELGSMVGQDDRNVVEEGIPP